MDDPSVWLRGNHRLVQLAAIGTVVAAGVVLFCGLLNDLPTWSRWLGLGLALPALSISAATLFFALGPRITCDGKVLRLRMGGPRRFAVPLEFVECFLHAKESTAVVGTDPDQVSVRNIIIRIAERAKDWQRRPVHPWFGRWCEGYVTVSGLWCEPIHAQLLADLNRQLVSAHRRLRTP